MRISAIVPVWNGRELLQRLLVTLSAQTRAPEELLVVDNGSTDDAPDVGRRAGARVIEMGRNAGFAAAVNRGIRESRGEWIAVLNSDVELAPDYLERLSATTAWFATGKILRRGDPGRVDATFDAVCRGGAACRVGSGCQDGPTFADRGPIWSAPWTAALFRADLFHRIGMLDESFESYLEDVDFGLRCAKAGLSGEYIPDAVAWHRGSATLGQWHPDTVRRIARNQVLLLARHYPERLLVGWMWHIVVAQVLWGAVAGRHGAGAAWLRGKVEGLRAYRAARNSKELFDPAVLERTLLEYERMIHDAQSAAGFDLYWRLYFLMTGSGAK